MPILNWESKKELTPVPASLAPFNVVYPHGYGYPPSGPESLPQDRVILGDNLPVMSALLSGYEGKIDLIYADPPFFSNRQYSARVGRGEDSRRPKDWHLTEGYTDDWPDLDVYLDMLYPRLQMIYRLLAQDGTLYLHLDWHANSYARVLLDEIFGPDRMLNEIIWTYHGPSPIRSAFNRKHDTILVYTKGKGYTFNADAVRTPYNPNTVKTFASSPKAGFGKVPDLKRGKVPEDWWYFPVIARLHNERTGYPTQKPEALLTRIILASSNPGDLVADFFCGSGTTAVVAERQGRHYIVSDVNWLAVHTTRKRLISIPAKPFVLEKELNAEINIHDLDQPNSIEIKDDSISLGSAIMPDLDFWEVDPNWDGELFSSAGQAARPLKKEPLGQEIQLPPSSLGDLCCIRFVNVNGEQRQIVEKGI
jgi:site-specific DNA-methyltransferase (adenine-specific)